MRANPIDERPLRSNVKKRTKKKDEIAIRVWHPPPFLYDRIKNPALQAHYLEMMHKAGLQD
jgi:hypothetical protein